MDIKGELRRWLEKGENQERLRKISLGILRACKRKGLMHWLIGRNLQMEAVTDELINDVASQLIVFVLENKPFHKTLETHYLIRAAVENPAREPAPVLKDFGGLLMGRFIKKLIDKARGNRDMDSGHYLYDRIEDLLKETGDSFHVSKEEHGYSAFSMVPDAALLDEVYEDDLARIAFPDHLVEDRSYESINRKEVVPPLAEYFWTALTEALGKGPFRINLRDFIHWLRLYIPMDIPVLAGDRESDTLPGSGAPVEDFEDTDMIQKMLPFVIHHLTRQNMQAFFYHGCLEYTLQETAKEMGLKGPSGADYHFSEAKKKIQRFMMENNLPGLKPGDLDEQLFELFFDLFCRTLEKDLFNPEIQK